MFWRCKVIRNAWARTKLCSLLLFSGANPFLMFQCAYDNLASADFEEFCVFLWAIWNMRNRYVWSVGSDVSVDHDLGLFETYYISKYRARFASPSPAQHVSRLPWSDCKWSPPTGLVYKLNSVAAFRPEGAQVGGGLVLRDCDGQVLMSAANIFPQCDDVDMAEGLVLLEGVKLALQLGFSGIQVETDSLRLVRVLRGEVEDVSEVGSLMHTLLLLVRDDPLFQATYVPCEGSRDVHELAQLAFSSSIGCVWIEDWPSVVSVFLVLDSAC